MDQDLKAFLRVLDPADNSTGGGTASAVAGAMAAALCAMVARLSVGKKDMEPEDYYQPIIDEGERLAGKLMAGSREDSQAFDLVREAYRLPKESEAEKAARRAAIDAAMLHATRVPLGNAEDCARVLELCRALTGRSNPNAGSDLGSARALAAAGLAGCLANVDINLPGVAAGEGRDEIERRAADLRAVLAAAGRD